MSDDERSAPPSDVVVITAKDFENSDDEESSYQSSRKSSISSCKSSVMSFNPSDANLFEDESTEVFEDHLFNNEIVPLDNSIPEADYNKIYTNAIRLNAIVYLIMFSIFLIIFPGFSMYMSYYYIFMGLLQEDSSTAMVHSGMVAIAETYAIVFAFVCVAYFEEVHLQQVVNGVDKPKDKNQ